MTPEVLQSPRPLPALLAAAQEVPEDGLWEWLRALPEPDFVALLDELEPAFMPEEGKK